jgi:hypothetical protein
MTASIDPTGPSRPAVPSELPVELTGRPPRPLPDSVHQSALAQSRRNVFWGTMTAGGVCGALATMPFIDTLALYFLPLGYLHWIAAFLIGAAVFSRFGNGEWKKACRYVENGEASLARVESLVKTPTVVVNGQATQYALVAGLGARHPETGERVSCTAQSRNFAAEKKDSVDTTFRVGDDVPVVWLPGKFPKSLQVFEFLEISPDATLVRRLGKPTPLWKVVGTLLLILGFFCVLFWNVYAFGRYELINEMQGIQWPMIVGGTLGFGGVLACLFVARKNRRELLARNAEALNSGAAMELPLKSSLPGRVFFWALMFFGGALLTGMTVYCWCLTANALLDRSPAQRRPVAIDEMVQVTHSLIFREYNLKYHFLDHEEKHELLTTPQHLQQFEAPVGMAVIRDGRFGWPWVETIEPVAVLDVQEPAE